MNKKLLSSNQSGFKPDNFCLLQTYSKWNIEELTKQSARFLNPLMSRGNKRS